jgi:hypothetical protein
MAQKDRFLRHQNGIAMKKGAFVFFFIAPRERGLLSGALLSNLKTRRPAPAKNAYMSLF